MRRRRVESLDLLCPPHREVFFDLIMENQAELMNDHLQDPLLLIGECGRRFKDDSALGFILIVDDKPAGACWLEINFYGIGYIHGAIFKPYRNLFNALWFLQQVLDYAFYLGGLRKLAAEVPTYNKAAEKVLRLGGFTKEGLLKDAFRLKGAPQKLVILGLTKDEYEERASHGKRIWEKNKNPRN